MTKLTPPAIMLLALTGCSAFEPDYYNCNAQVSSYAEGVRSSIVTEESNQAVEVRLNGVSARCYDSGDMVIAELGIGMKVSRDLEQGVDVEPVTVPMVAAVIDNDDSVKQTMSFVYTMQFTRNLDVLYPLVRREFTIPKGGRIILSLTPEVVSQ
ncbi:MAG: hypothetical protein ACON49_01380 [Candidatus Puniceispirillaceae bacterium]